MVDYHYLDLQYITWEHDHRVLHNKLELSYQIPLFVHFLSIFGLSIFMSIFSYFGTVFSMQKLIHFVSKA